MTCTNLVHEDVGDQNLTISADRRRCYEISVVVFLRFPLPGGRLSAPQPHIYAARMSIRGPSYELVREGGSAMVCGFGGRVPMQVSPPRRPVDRDQVASDHCCCSWSLGVETLEASDGRAKRDSGPEEISGEIKGGRGRFMSWSSWRWPRLSGQPRATHALGRDIDWVSGRG